MLVMVLIIWDVALKMDIGEMVAFVSSSAIETEIEIKTHPQLRW